MATSVAHLTAAHRKTIPTRLFADPKHRKYPEDTPGRAVAAERFAARYASPALLARVRALAHARYPSLGKSR